MPDCFCIEILHAETIRNDQYMQTILLWIRRFSYPLLLTLLVGIIVGANYTPGTYLTGWDTLHPEFNLQLAFSRVMSGVWRADQGLGAVAIQSHMAEIPRLLYLWIASLIFPVQALRYSYFFLMLIFGPLGIYVLIKKILGHEASKAAFIGALVYLCNFATVQQFIVPLEMFATQYGLLPWILLNIIHFLEKPTKLRLAVLTALSFFASAQAHTATLLYAYLVEIALILATFLVLHLREFRMYVKRVVIVFGIILATNLYIILPNIYAAGTHGKDVAKSKVNRLFSPEAFAKGQMYGTPSNAAIIKNFLFDWELYDNKNHTFTPVLGPWISFANNPVVVATGYSVFGFSLLGVVWAFKKKQKRLLSLLPIYLVSFAMLLNGTWPLPKLYDMLGSVAPVAREALRFPFTKFSILFIAGLSVFTANAIERIYRRMYRKNIWKNVITITITIALIFSLSPAFKGYLIQPAMRISIPQEYFDMFTWFNTQPSDGRVAILPIHSFWNWTYYTWGYQGAGFLQFGIPQPILDRDYDRWSPFNEQYEREMSYAIYSQNPDNIRNVLNKYNVTWVLVDNSVFAPASNENQTLLWLLPELLSRAGLTKEQSFGRDITIYRAPTSQSAVVGYTDLPIIAPLNPYFVLMDTNERLVTQIPGTIVAESKAYQFTSTDVPKTNRIDLPSLDHGRNYILEITSKNESGFPLQLCVNNSLTSHCDLYVYLGTQKVLTQERFLIPKLNDFGTGYSLNFNNFAIRGVTSTNTIEHIRIHAIPQTDSELSYTQPAPITETVEQLFPLFYRVKITSPTALLVLNESFERGWIAVKDGKILKNHTEIKSWANGWNGYFGTNDIIYIIFWPQLLEWLGFVILPFGCWIANRHI